jgi:ribosomal-protein-alanine N-acetyltransferase
MLGWGGYKGAPSDDGEVEIGYAIAPTFRGRGLATLAAQTIIARAFEAPRVNAILAHTLPEKNASVRVLEKLRFVFAGGVEEEGHGRVWRWRLRRSSSYNGDQPVLQRSLVQGQFSTSRCNRSTSPQARSLTRP